MAILSFHDEVTLYGGLVLFVLFMFKGLVY